jgi:hypothetical protein
MRLTRHTRALTAAVLAAAVGALAAAPTAGAAPNGLELASEIITYPDSYRVYVGIRGRITAISPGRIARRCRRTPRTAELSHISIAGERYSFGVRIPSTGRFNIEPEVEYSGVDEEGSFYDGDVPLSGGRVTFTVKVLPTEVPRALGPSDLKLYKCKALKATTVVDVPPSK